MNEDIPLPFGLPATALNTRRVECRGLRP